jgi:hypothetical protein
LGLQKKICLRGRERKKGSKKKDRNGKKENKER